MLPTLHIQTTDAYIGLQSEKPPMQIEQPNADVQIRQRHTDIISISTKAAKLYIDQTEAFADANLKSPLRVANEFWQKTTPHMMEYIGKVAQEGDRMMRIEDGGEIFAQLAKENSERPPVQTGLQYMPRSMSQVSFRYEPGDVSIDAAYEDLSISVQRRPPKVNIPKWKTNVYMRQMNSISFDVVGRKMNDRY